MTDSGVHLFKLVFTAPCPDCGELKLVNDSGKCPECSVPLDVDAVAAVRQAIRKRRQAFKVRLLRLEQRMHEVTDGPLDFKSQGVSHSPEEHFTEVLIPTREALSSLNEAVVRLLSTQDWNPEQPDCIAAFTLLMRLLDDALDSINTLQATVPPLDWRAVHRELTRAIASNVRGHVL